MLTIKTHTFVLTKEKNTLLSATYAMGQLYIKFPGQEELIIPMEAESGLMNTVTHMLTTATAENITIDLTNSQQIISFT